MLYLRLQHLRLLYLWLQHLRLLYLRLLYLWLLYLRLLYLRLLYLRLLYLRLLYLRLLYLRLYWRLYRDRGLYWRLYWKSVQVAPGSARCFAYNRLWRSLGRLRSRGGRRSFTLINQGLTNLILRETRIGPQDGTKLFF